jgi:CRP-like cAMP-binding protein
VGFVSQEAPRGLCTRYPRIASAFWRETLLDAAIFREWVMNVGRRETYNRMAHVLCELLVRLRAIGLAEGHFCDLPITQGEFADTLGVTNVHLNRVLQKLRADGLIEPSGERLNILDCNKLKQIGEFDPTYLHLEKELAAA